MEQVVKEYDRIKKKFIDEIYSKMGDVYLHKEKELIELVSFIKYTDSMFNYLIDMVMNYQAIDFKIDAQNNSIQKLLSVYSVMIAFNEKEARKTLVNGLVKIIADEYVFDGVYFTKGKDKVRYTKIIKKEQEEKETLRAKYLKFKDEYIR